MAEDFLTLSNLGQGAAEELFKEELRRVLANILDPNTKATTVRSIQLKLTFKPNDDRDAANMVIAVDSKLAPVKPFDSTIDIGQVVGTPVASERISRRPNYDESNVTNIKEASRK